MCFRLGWTRKYVTQMTYGLAQPSPLLQFGPIGQAGRLDLTPLPPSPLWSPPPIFPLSHSLEPLSPLHSLTLPSSPSPSHSLTLFSSSSLSSLCCTTPFGSSTFVYSLHVFFLLLNTLWNLKIHYENLMYFKFP